MDAEDTTDDWSALCARLDTFAEDYCRKKPSLAMLSTMAWVLGVEIDFRLVPRDEPEEPIDGR